MFVVDQKTHKPVDLLKSTSEFFNAEDEVKSGKDPDAVKKFNQKYGLDPHAASQWDQFWGNLAHNSTYDEVMLKTANAGEDIYAAGKDVADLGDDAWSFLKWFWEHPWLALAIGVGGFIGVFLLIRWAMGGIPV